MSRICTTSLDELCVAVATLTIKHEEYRSGGYSIDASSETVVTALHEITSGLYASEHPDAVDAAVQFLLPVLWCEDTFRECFRQFCAQQDAVANCIAFFARRAANLFVDAVKHADTASDDVVRVGSGSVPLFLGALGEFCQNLRALKVIALSCASEQHYLGPSEGAADLLYACYVAKEAPCSVHHLEHSDPLKVAADMLLHETHECAAQLLEHLPSLFRRSSKSLESLICRTWTESNSPIQSHLTDTRQAEDEFLDFEPLLARQSLPSSSAVAKALSVSISTVEDMDNCLPVILAAVLPFAGDTSKSRRLDTISVIAHCMRVSSRRTIQCHSEAILIALKDSLFLQDCDTSLACFPVLPDAMDLVCPTMSISSIPPKAWKDAWRAALSDFTTHVNQSDRNSSLIEGGSVEDHLVTAASIAIYIPLMAKVFVLTELKLVLTAMGTLLERLSRLIAVFGPSFTDAHRACTQAFEEVLRYAWPRMSQYADIVLKAAYSSVLTVRACKDDDARALVAHDLSDLLVMLSKCVPKSRMTRYLNVVSRACDKKPSLSAALELSFLVRTKLDHDPTDVGEHDQELFTGNLSCKFFCVREPTESCQNR